MVLQCGHTYSREVLQDVVDQDLEHRCLVCGPGTIPPSAHNLRQDRTYAAVVSHLVSLKALDDPDEDGYVLLPPAHVEGLRKVLRCQSTGQLLEDPGPCESRQKPVVGRVTPVTPALRECGLISLLPTLVSP